MNATASRRLAIAACGAGAAVVAWVGAGYLATSALALVMTLLIGAVYGAGALELWRFAQATSALQRALAALPGPLAPPDGPAGAPTTGDSPASAPAALAAWLATLPAGLRQPVRQRIEGERSGLPGPVMAPYLVGLLVLLGMLGTFLGMVVTLDGAVLALETTTDLPTIRAALAAPVKGLGLAFGTSVAGVAASAMLGGVSALCRRGRLQALQQLDGHIATSLHAFSRRHQREQALAALQAQAQVLPTLLPQVVEQLRGVVAQMAEQHAQRSAQQAQVADRLMAGQQQFHQRAGADLAALAASVDRSLQTSLAHSLAEGTRIASATLGPALARSLAAITAETAAFQVRTEAALQQQLQGLAQRFDASLAAAGQAQLALQADLAARDQQRLAGWTDALATLAQGLQQQGQQAQAEALARQQQLCATLAQTARDIQEGAEAQARHTQAEVARLMDAAAQAPRAAAEVVGLLRHQLSDSLARDNGLLEERSRIMATLGSLLDAVNQAAGAQRGAIDGLVAAAGTLLQQAGAEFGQRIDAETARLADAATQARGSSLDMASLGEAFGEAVQLFADSSQAVTAQLQRIESALDKSSARSDSQLAYYLAQAREIIDLSLSSQKQIVDDLQALALRQGALPAGPAGPAVPAGAAPAPPAQPA